MNSWISTKDKTPKPGHRTMIRYRVDLDIWVDEKSEPNIDKIEKHLRIILNNYKDVSVISIKAEQIVSEEANDG